MQFRCYTCGFVMRNGIPPMEALSSQQSSAVGGIYDSNTRFSLLEGTLFDGLSTYQFCTFCLTVIMEYPSWAMKDKEAHDIQWTQDRDGFRWKGLYCKTCDHEIFRFTRKEEDSFPYNLYAFMNRERTRHELTVLYPSVSVIDFSNITSLIYKEA